MITHTALSVHGIESVTLRRNQAQEKTTRWLDIEIVGSRPNAGIHISVFDDTGTKDVTVVDLTKEDLPHVWKQGERVRLIGPVQYGQDYGFHEADFGIGKVFTVAGFINADRLILSADGYGDKNSYGNGCLFVDVKDCHVES